jgi:hypothetical protein
MAFWSDTLINLGGFDPVFKSAGDDIDLCWRLLDSGGEIGFHPAAVVWHHRRPSARAYLRQQRSYGHSEALVEARHPDRFTTLGTARWLGSIYTSSGPRWGRQRIYRGAFGTAPFQSIYRRENHVVDIANQLGVPTGVMLGLTAPLGALFLALALPALAGVVLLAALGTVNVVRAKPAAVSGVGRVRVRVAIAALTMAQPLVRAWGHTHNRTPALRSCAAAEAWLRPTGRAKGHVFIYDADRDRAVLAAALIARLRRGGLRVLAATGWEDYDARISAGPFVCGEMIATEHPKGCIQVRVRRRARTWVLAGTAAVAGGALLISFAAFAAVAAVAALGALWGLSRTGRCVDRLLMGATS